MNTMTWTIIIVVLLIILKIVEHYIPQIRGYLGEKQVKLCLSSLPQNEYKIIHNIMLRTEQGSTTQIDHIVVSVYGIFVVETKNYSGMITGEYNSKMWTEHKYRYRYPFYNPIRQNYGHVKALEYLLKLPKDKFISIICFTTNAQVKVKAYTPVIHITELKDTIQSYTYRKIGTEEIVKIADRIKDANIDSIPMRREHIRYVKSIQKGATS